MSTEEPPVRGARPSKAGGPNVGTTLGIVAAVVAVILGFFILRDISGDGGTSTPGGGGATPTTATDTTLAPETSPPTTVAPIITTGFKVLVANASGVGGSAGQMTIALQGKGFIVENPTNKATSAPTAEVTKVYYLSGNEQAAESVARVLGGVCTEAMPTSPPTESGSLGEASVLVMLGSDLAGKPLPAETTEACVDGGVAPSEPTDTTVDPTATTEDPTATTEAETTG
jgi:hypothetical protein